MRHAAAWGVWSLRSHLSALLMATMLLTLAVVGAVVLAYGIPRLERASRVALRHEVGEMAERMELLLRTRQTRLELVELLLHDMAPQHYNSLLDKSVRNGNTLRVVYRVSAQGRVEAVGLPAALQARRADLLGSDVSANSLFRAVPTKTGVVWSGRYRSILTGDLTAGMAYRDGDGHVMIAEVPIGTLLGTVELAAGGRSSSIWVVDRSGEIIAHTGQGDDVGKLNIRNWPLMQDLLQGREVATRLRFQGGDFHVAAAHSRALDWYFVAKAPAGLANPEVLTLVLHVATAFAACAVIGLLMAPFWASRLVRPLQRIVARAAQTTAGGALDLSWPHGSVAEFNRLSSDLERMAMTLQEREQTAQAIFNAAPVPMTVRDRDNEYRFVDVNSVWCRELGRDRAQVLGRTSREIGLWTDDGAAARVQQRVLNNEALEDAWLLRGDGSRLMMQLYGRLVDLPSARLTIGVCVDVSPMRRIEAELRDLNQQLEARVERRTAALAASHEALSQTVAQLRTAQDELVRSEKMAALGHLVAGVAHELNTPLGNGVMAVSALAHAMQRFKAGAADGVKRADLAQLVDSVAQCVDIAERNLRRAAELVQSFKQVAVDQTSSQRRRFEISEVVHETVVSLRPSFSRTPYRIEVDVPASGLQLDSYPGALGQALSNLVQNALLHGFEGRDRGTVRITAGRDATCADDRRIWLCVADDGHPIAPEHVDHIFEPFMTTKMGRAGTGLGLHISHNAVVDVLGGTLTVRSVEGEGSRFELRLPASAPAQRPSDFGAMGSA
ncbi:sensor histidine kinase [Pseudorhodoferax soli]|uniref:histidine kinase n=1 Tax=Pseudorhodoferax soli TaxID=545864 RepID=A0A368Y5J7_9BURK|nr:ATP-binding protein [Pseudorhodoferax soli]RCW75472.1 PAS domain S-box-containing protein [Pseudorhodoferax soli]